MPNTLPGHKCKRCEKGIWREQYQLSGFCIACENKNRDEALKPGPKKCLRCSELFSSKSAANRLCSACRSGEEYEAYVDEFGLLK